MTAADELRTAADKLRALTDAPDLTPGPWLSLDHGDRMLYDGPDAETQPPVYVIDEPMSNGANADYIETMHPGVGLALVDWLDATATALNKHAAPAMHAAFEPEALAVARQINGTAP